MRTSHRLQALRGHAQKWGSSLPRAAPVIGVGAFSGWGSYLFVLEAGWQPGAFGDSMEIWRVPAKLSPPGENTACKACYKQVKGQCSRRGSCMRDWGSLPSPGAKPLAGRQGRGRDGQGGLELMEGASPDHSSSPQAASLLPFCASFPSLRARGEAGADDPRLKRTPKPSAPQR